MITACNRLLIQWATAAGRKPTRAVDGNCSRRAVICRTVDGHIVATCTAWNRFLWLFWFFAEGIYAFDPESDLKIKSSAFGRMSFGITASLILSALWRWPLEGVALASFIGAVLGYFGLSWAKYADF
jgi:hypothetical protein